MEAGGYVGRADTKILRGPVVSIEFINIMACWYSKVLEGFSLVSTSGC